MSKQRMTSLREDRVHTFLLEGIAPSEPIAERRYTLTFSRLAKHVYVSIGLEYNQQQISGMHTKLVRSELCGQWVVEPESALHLYVHVSDKHLCRRAKLRDRALRRRLPLALCAIRFSERYFFVKHPELDESPVYVHFESHLERYHGVETWGQMKDYMNYRPNGKRH